jgi:putative transposase
MTKPYSMDLRERVVAAVEREAMSPHVAAARDGVAVSTAIKWVRRGRATGSVSPGRMGGHRVGVLTGQRDWLLE